MRPRMNVIVDYRPGDLGRGGTGIFPRVTRTRPVWAGKDDGRHRDERYTRLAVVTRVHERCEACGFDGGAYGTAALLDSLRLLGDSWREQLSAAGEHLRTRPEPDTWSAIEYAAHSRDITRLHAYGVEQALTGAEPTFPAVSDDAIEAAAAAYGDADPDEVLDALARAATRLAQLADDAGEHAWTRGLTVGETRSDVRRLLEHALHDSHHHLLDVNRGLATIAQ
jgi:hypothetical protein